MNRSARGDRADGSHLKGLVALAKGKGAEAVDDFELSLRLRIENSTLDSLAWAYAAVGKTGEAIARYRELSERVELGNEEQEYWILAHYALGKLYEQQKEIEKAKEQYRKLLDVWKEADPDLQPLKDAKARLERL
jgi:tetratricopeptide (TPR) repeat protein